MASSSISGYSLLEESQISLEITTEDAPEFVQTNGVFYQANAEIGGLVAALHGKALKLEHYDMFKSKFDQRIAKILENYVPTFTFLLGPHEGAFYASTTAKEEGTRLSVYMWGENTVLEFSFSSHLGEYKGLTGLNGLIAIPYTQLTKRGFQDFRVNMKEGGVTPATRFLSDIWLVKGLCLSDKPP
ncbi:hypothetical protein F4677DRAFT_451772 [Hypoxylon crocopeplum]|nr:hypothetical protein F4677DRAFT_451772 [Hypoxylon crocopeplum]